ncbi:MAG: FadR family transcriptional regulator [Deltaproteobacteria bacterium]|nr:FadR family transcriptional regulator [Deltaproteobacteria bacterium]
MAHAALPCVRRHGPVAPLALRSWAARLAAGKRTEAELDLIRDYLEAMEHYLERGQIRAEVDFLFHAEIAAATHNRILLHLMQSIHELVNYSVKVHREQVFVNREDQETLFAHHLSVFKAIQNQDPEAAEAAMKEHLKYVISEYKRRFLPNNARGQRD